MPGTSLKQPSCGLFCPSSICLNAKAVLERKGSFEVVLRKVPVDSRLQV